MEKKTGDVTDDRSEEYEAALPGLVDRLKDFNKDLSVEERELFAEIIESAAKHTEFVQADDEGRHDKKLYMKPPSSHATANMKQTYLDLPVILGHRGQK